MDSSKVYSQTLRPCCWESVRVNFKFSSLTVAKSCVVRMWDFISQMALNRSYLVLRCFSFRVIEYNTIYNGSYFQ